MSRVAAELEGNVRATSPYNSGSFDVSGVEALFPELRTIPIGEGRFFTDREEKAGERVCIIGVRREKAAIRQPSRCYGRVTSRSIRIPFRIIGLMANKEQNSSYSGLDEKKIWLPYTHHGARYAAHEVLQPGYLDEILYQPRSLDQLEEAADAGPKVIGRAHGFDPADKSALGIWDTVESQKQVDGIFDSMTVFLGFHRTSLRCRWAVSAS